jgi:S1-C subfamily serine protease
MGIRQWMSVLGLSLMALVAGAESRDHRVSNSVVQIRGVTPDLKTYFGSGVVVAPQTIATNCHVVRPGGTLGIYRGYRSYGVQSLRVDMARDLCLLDVPDLDFHPARLGPFRGLKPGEPLAYYGFPRALSLAYAQGEVLRLSKVSGVPLIETSAFFTLGGSGGGLFDSKGRLMGLATYISRGHGGGYFAISSDLIAEVMKRPKVPVAPIEGTAFWERVPSPPTSP